MQNIIEMRAVCTQYAYLNEGTRVDQSRLRKIRAEQEPQRRASLLVAQNRRCAGRAVGQKGNKTKRILCGGSGGREGNIVGRRLSTAYITGSSTGGFACADLRERCTLQARAERRAART